MNDFTNLTKDEIDVRVASCSAKGCSLLLYKDARVDQNRLDKVFGIYGWKRSHQLIGDRLYCTVEIKSPDGEWIAKQDVGTESNTEKEKGQASDSFKRACFNLGIGRELYSAPFIWIAAANCTLKEDNGKYKVTDRFSVKEIGYNDKSEINKLVIYNNTKRKVVFTLGQAEEEPAEEESTMKPYPERDEMLKLVQEKYPKGTDKEKQILEFFKVEKLEDAKTEQLMAVWNKYAKD